MKAATVFQLVLGLLIVLSFSLPSHSFAQESGYPEPSEKYSREELAQMLAPIALYPDVLLSQVLMASTYPIELIEADRWVRKNPNLKGESLDALLLEKDWDPSVKALCHFPTILALMSEQISETTNLGNAFLAQETEVMDLVQELRAKAHAQGNLSSTPQQKVIVEKETIIIRPADPRVIYVPYYDPLRIYGSWWYPAYPPYYWGPPGVRIGIGISYWSGFSFSFAFGSWSYFDWPHRHIYIDVHRRPRFVRHDRWIAKPGHWQHLPSHRRGVAYRDKPTARKYGQYPYRSKEFHRETRGFPVLPDRAGARDPGRDSRMDERPMIDRGRQDHEEAELDRRRRERSERERLERERTERDRQRVERDRQERERIDRDRQTRQRAEQEQRTRQRAEREQQQRSRDNVFNRVEDGRKERQSSERGRVSRQGRGDDSRGRSRSEDDGRDGRDRRRDRR